MPHDRTLVQTESGPVRGEMADGVLRFLGIPYAAAPWDELRFKAPQPVQWTEVRAATAYGATVPQLPYPGQLGELLPPSSIRGAEVLNLNVWAPNSELDQLKPVLFWIHGGALTRGSNSLGLYEGTSFAQHGVVAVSVNYRLGLEGFSLLPEVPPNLGVADLLAALRWVSQNIAQFGGDPQRITIAGQSAGGAMVAALLASAQAEGLFSQAIIQSGPIAFAPRAEAERFTKYAAKNLGIPADRASFAKISPLRLAKAAALAIAPKLQRATVSAVADGVLIAGDPLAETSSARASARIPVLAGWTADELRLWFKAEDLEAMSWLKAAVLAATGAKTSPWRIWREHRNNPKMTAGDLVVQLAGREILESPAEKMMTGRFQQGAAPGWLYEFKWKSPVRRLGAAHAMELGFVFNTLNSSESSALTGPNPPQELAEQMHNAWVNFIKQGDPGWPSWQPDSEPFSFNAG